MSFPAIRWAIEQVASPTEKLVLILIANKANKDTQQCFPSIATLARESGYSRRAVTRSISKLIELGLISRANRFSNNRQTSNMYQVNTGETPALIECPDFDLGVPQGHGVGDTGSYPPCHTVTQNHSILLTSKVLLRT